MRKVETKGQGFAHQVVFVHVTSGSRSKGFVRLEQLLVVGRTKQILKEELKDKHTPNNPEHTRSKAKEQARELDVHTTPTDSTACFETYKPTTAAMWSYFGDKKASVTTSSKRKIKLHSTKKLMPEKRTLKA